METVALQERLIKQGLAEEPTAAEAVEVEGLRVGVEVRIAMVTTP